MESARICLICVVMAVVPCAARTITVDDDGPAEFTKILSAIVVAEEGYEIIVSPGIYYESIIIGRNIILRSTDPMDSNVVAGTVIDGSLGPFGSVVFFQGTESPACILSGFTITGGRRGMGCIVAPGAYAYCGGGIYGNGTLATIQYNIIFGNGADPSMWPSFGYGGGIYDCDGTIQYNVISANYAVVDELGSSGGGLYGCDGTIKNNTISYNAADIGGGIANCNGTVSNCIIWCNYWSDIYNCGATVTYSDIGGSYPGTGNIVADPCFAKLGYWDENLVLVDTDYHLKSQGGRWDPNSESWVKDDVTSLCIDKGDPMTPIGLEPFPNGGIINMGAYGGTPEASKSYFGKPPCKIIVAGDINGDCEINFKDYKFIALHWLEDNNPFNSNSIVEYGIEYYIQTDKAVYHLGENVEMLFRVTNLRNEDVIIGCSRSPEFNFKAELCAVPGLCVRVWRLYNAWWAFSPGIELSPGESTEVSYSWDMKDGMGNPVLPTTDYPPGAYYNSVGFIYNEFWNYDNGEGFIETEVGVPITIIP